MLALPRAYTVESVRAGHPDKVCDQISDAVLDACLTQDSTSRVAVETFGGHGVVMVCGELTTVGYVNVRGVVADVMRDVGYSDIGVMVNIVEQSREIGTGVDGGGAGDQGIMYGYATDDTDVYLPRGVVLAHEIARTLDMCGRDGRLPWLRPDGKVQITVSNGSVAAVVISVQHDERIGLEEIIESLTQRVVLPLGIDLAETQLLINPSGSFVRGGFDADTGLTGRKLMVDTYGGLAPHGGGCFSGKDATKVDRSGAYMARFAAKNIVANGYAKTCTVAVAYAIGKADPLMVTATTETGEDISDLVKKNFDFRPQAIIERLGLNRPIFRQTALYGHFGHSTPWEEIVKLS